MRVVKVNPVGNDEKESARRPVALAQPAVRLPQRVPVLGRAGSRSRIGAIVGGVAVAGTVGGLAAAGTFSSSSSVSGQ